MVPRKRTFSASLPGIPKWKIKDNVTGSYANSATLQEGGVGGDLDRQVMEVSPTDWDCGSVPTSGHLLTCGMASLVLSALLRSQKNPEFYMNVLGF